MKKAEIKNGLVVNIIEIDPENVPTWCLDWPDATETTKINDAFVQGVFVEPTESAEELQAKLDELRSKMQLSFAQLLIGLVSETWITEVEGEAWLAGTLPAPVLALIETLPVEQQFAAKAKAIRPSIVERADPLVAALGLSQGKTEEELDIFFQTYVNV